MLLAILVGAVCTVYYPVIHAGFIWDDDAFLTNNPLIKAPDGLYRFWFTTEPPDYFPLTSSLLWLEWRLWGNHPLGYHAMNVALHAASSLLLWRVLERLKVRGAWLAACIFAIHPVNVESVAWITEVKNALAMFLYLSAALGFICFEDTRRFAWYALSLAAYTLALFSKTAVVMLPFVLLGLAWWRRGYIRKHDIWNALPYFCLSLIFGLVTVWFQSHRAIGGEVVRDDSFAARLAGAGWAVCFYAYKLFWPLNLSFVYPRWAINPKNVVVWLPLTAITAFFFAAWQGRRSWGKPALLGGGYFLLLLLPVIGFVDIYFMRFSFVSDHWQYFAMIGPVALAAAGLARFNTPALAGVACSGGLLLMLGVLSWRHTHMFTNSLSLWSTTVARNPASALAQYNLGCTLLSADDAAMAFKHFKCAIALDPNLADAQNNLGNLLLQKGHHAEAIAHFEAALRARPLFADAHNNLGGALVDTGQFPAAVREFQRALEINPRDASGHYNLGSALLKSGRLSEAIVQFQEAVAIDHGFVAAYRRLGSALLRAGNREAAITCWRKTLSLNPSLASVHSDLGTILLESGAADEALLHYEDATKLEPNNPLLLNNLAWLLATCPAAKLRDGPRALTVALDARRLMKSETPDVLGTVAAAYAENGLFTNAIQTATRALALAEAQSNVLQVQTLQRHLALYRAGAAYYGSTSTNGAGAKRN